jgi:hypothetical protein
LPHAQRSLPLSAPLACRRLSAETAYTSPSATVGVRLAG